MLANNRFCIDQSRPIDSPFAMMRFADIGGLAFDVAFDL